MTPHQEAPSKPQGLTLLDNAKKLLHEAKSLDEIKSVRDKAEAARTYARAAKMGLELQNQAAEVKLRAERKAGIFLSRLKLRGGDRKSNGQRARLKLEELGINQDESKRWQLMASVPSNEFEYWVTAKKGLAEEITAAELLRLARGLRKQRDKNPAKNGSISSQPQAAKPSTAHSTLCEMREHHELLVQILRPIYEGNLKQSLGPLKRGECRAVGHLLKELKTCLTALERDLTRIGSDQRR